MEITQISNELEFCLDGADAATLIEHSDLELVHEVNPRQIVEMNVSLANDVGELNSRLESDVNQLVHDVENLGGRVYGGSSLLEDVSDIEPRWYRTTSLSRRFARSLLDITSQQIVIGVRDDGIELFNYLRLFEKDFLALSASSPYRVAGKRLVDTGYQSRRLEQYRHGTHHFPISMLKSCHLESMDHYQGVLQDISDKVKSRLYSGMLDANMEELDKHMPFDCLEPHQIFWMTRLRPDHANEQSDYSIELRICDLPCSISKMQMLNSLVVGLCYSYQDNYSEGDIFATAQRGLRRRGLNDRMLYTNDAMLIREFDDRDRLKDYLVGRLR